MTIRLLIADDHAWVREGLRFALQRTEIEIVAEATNVEEAVRMALEQTVDVALLDIKMPNGTGIYALSRIKAAKPDLPVLIYSAYNRPDYIQRCIALGASTFLRKGVDNRAIIDAIRAADARHGAPMDADERTKGNGTADQERGNGPASNEARET